MMKHLLALALAVVGPGSMAVAAAPQDDAAALMQTSRDWAKAAAGGNVDVILAYWADDAVVMAPDQPVVDGKAALREMVLGMQKIPGFTIAWEPERAFISGDLGYLIERNRVTFTGADGAVKTQYGKAVTIWRKDASGAWKCVVDAWNNNPTEHVFTRGGSGMTP